MVINIGIVMFERPETKPEVDWHKLMRLTHTPDILPFLHRSNTSISEPIDSR